MCLISRCPRPAPCVINYSFSLSDSVTRLSGARKMLPIFPVTKDCSRDTNSASGRGASGGPEAAGHWGPCAQQVRPAAASPPALRRARPLQAARLHFPVSPQDPAGVPNGLWNHSRFPTAKAVAVSYPGLGHHLHRARGPAASARRTDVFSARCLSPAPLHPRARLLAPEDSSLALTGQALSGPHGVPLLPGLPSTAQLRRIGNSADFGPLSSP